MAKPLILNKPVIAITGSAGKTTTKEMIASILEKRWKILKTYGNANAPRHVAMYAKRVTRAHQALVLEYGMSRHGEIRRSTQIIQPNIGVVTNVGTAHIGHFNGDVKGIANTKSDLIRYMKKTGTLFLNADDMNSKLLDTKNFKGKIITIGQENDATYKAEQVTYVKRGMGFKTKINNEAYEFQIPVYGKHNIYNALFAIAVASTLGFTPKEIQRGLSTYRKPKHRLSIYNVGNGIKIVDDTFSANPTAVKAAVDVLSIIGNGKKIAVIGTMLEMGKYKVKGHKDVGKHLARKKVDRIFTYGKDAKFIAQGALEQGFAKNKIHSFITEEKLISALKKHIVPNTTVLFKASHGMHLGRVAVGLARYYTKRKGN